MTDSLQQARSAITFLLGCTGSGKGAVGRLLAERVGAEIISVDSMKIYRRMDIGTAKPTAAQRARVPHYLLDVVEPSQEFSVAQFVAAAEHAIRDIAGRGKLVLCVGGTALYIKALSEGLFDGPSADPAIRARLKARAAAEGGEALHAELATIDPAAAGRIHPNDLRRLVRALEVYELTGSPITALQTQWDRERTRFDCTFLGLRHDREEQSRRTNLRVARMIDAGLVEEVRGLLAEPAPLSETARKAVGYAEMIAHLAGGISLDRAIEDIRINTRQFAKAQRTWFRRFAATRWIDLTPGDTAEGVAERLAGLEDTPWSRR